MFTLQSRQIENALRTVNVPDVSAREMMSGLANCQAALEHRGPVSLTQPNINYFPTIQPPGPNPAPRFTDNTRNVFLSIPPWQNVPFTPLPYLPAPRWQFTPTTGWQPSPIRTPTLDVPGPISVGVVTSPKARITKIITKEIVNGPGPRGGDSEVPGGIHNAGDTVTHNQYVQGDTTIRNNLTVLNNSRFDGPVQYGDTVTYEGPVYIDNSVFMAGPVFLPQNVNVGGQNLNVVPANVVVNVEWDNGVLKQTKQKVTVLGRLGPATTSTVFDCEGQ